MNLCEKLLTSCISADCENPIYAGLEQTAFIFNRAEVDIDAMEAASNKDGNLYKSIPMKTHTVADETVSYTGYKIVNLGKTPFTGSQTEMVEGNVANKFTNTFAFVVPDNSPAAAGILDNIAGGKFLVVVNNQHKGSDGKGGFQLYGVKKGLVASTMTNDKYSEETDGGWAINLIEENTPVSALFIQHTTTDTEDTASYLEGLVDCE